MRVIVLFKSIFAFETDDMKMVRVDFIASDPHSSARTSNPRHHIHDSVRLRFAEFNAHISL